MGGISNCDREKNETVPQRACADAHTLAADNWSKAGMICTIKFAWHELPGTLWSNLLARSRCPTGYDDQRGVGLLHILVRIRAHDGTIKLTFPTRRLVYGRSRRVILP